MVCGESHEFGSEPLDLMRSVVGLVFESLSVGAMNSTSNRTQSVKSVLGVVVPPERMFVGLPTSTDLALEVAKLAATIDRSIAELSTSKRRTAGVSSSLARISSHGCGGRRSRRRNVTASLGTGWAGPSKRDDDLVYDRGDGGPIDPGRVYPCVQADCEEGWLPSGRSATRCAPRCCDCDARPRCGDETGERGARPTHLLPLRPTSTCMCCGG